MIIDDHEMVRRGIRSLIESLPGFALCAEAASGSEARRLATKAAPDIVVLDLCLPDGCGIDLIGDLKARCSEAEILILSMRDSERAVAETLNQGARGYVLKSETGERLAEALGAVARHTTYLSPAVSEHLLGSQPVKDGPLTTPPAPRRPLTNRERQIVRLVASGKSNRSIAAMLDISIKTVESHRNAAMLKIGARSAADVVRYAVRNDLI